MEKMMANNTTPLKEDSYKKGKGKRPLFIPKKDGIGYEKRIIEFDWYMGMSKAVRVRSMQSLHKIASSQGFSNILEASSKSDKDIGIYLSAFYLTDEEGVAVENLFQSSKVFANGGPFLALKSVTPREAKRDPRLQQSGTMRGFSLVSKDFPEGKNFPLEPKSLFYDWLYVRTLFNACNVDLKDKLFNEDFEAFSDIEFNDKRSYSCQARALAIAMSLYHNESVGDFIADPENFAQEFDLYAAERGEQQSQSGNQGVLFDDSTP